MAICDLYPAPRCTLEYHGRNAVTRSATAGSAAVEAAASRERYGRSPAVDAGHADVVAHEAHREPVHAGSARRIRTVDHAHLLAGG